MVGVIHQNCYWVSLRNAICWAKCESDNNLKPGQSLFPFKTQTIYSYYPVAYLDLNEENENRKLKKRKQTVKLIHSDHIDLVTDNKKCYPAPCYQTVIELVTG